MTRIVLLILFGWHAAFAQGKDAPWATAAKNGFGTSNTLASKVWFTLADGVMTEVFYPTIDMPNVQTLQFQVVTGTKIENEIDDTVHRLELPNSSSLTFRQINRAKSGAYTITKTYITDPRDNVVLIDVDFDTQTDAQLYVYYDPSINNSGMRDMAWTETNALTAVDADKASALVASCGFTDASTSLVGSTEKPRRFYGNVVQRAALKQKRCTVALGFGESSQEALWVARKAL